VAVANGLRRPDTYIETSAILAVVFGQERTISHRRLLVARGFTSALTVAETSRVVMRGRAVGTLTTDDERRVRSTLQEFFSGCDVLPLSHEILLRAGRSFPVEPIRTLDAIHLATVESVGIPSHLIRVVTRDRRIRENALAMGYTVN